MTMKNTQDDAAETVSSTDWLGRVKAACSCEICARSREMRRIAKLLPPAEADKLLAIYEQMFNEAEEADMQIADLQHIAADAQRPNDQDHLPRA